MKNKIERVDKYWICDDCVRDDHPNWETAYPNGGNTVTFGLCGHCDDTEEKKLTPVSDYHKPNKRALWD